MKTLGNVLFAILILGMFMNYQSAQPVEPQEAPVVDSLQIILEEELRRHETFMECEDDFGSTHFEYMLHRDDYNKFINRVIKRHRE